jgi:hypothetical protein
LAAPTRSSRFRACLPPPRVEGPPPRAADTAPRRAPEPRA